MTGPRRAFLRAAAAAGGIAVAGCLGGGTDGGGTDGRTGEDGDDGSDRTEMDGMDDGGGGTNGSEDGGTNGGGGGETPDPNPDGDPPELLVLSGGSTDGANLHAGRTLSSVVYDADSEEFAVAGQYRPPDGLRITDYDATPGGYVVALGSGDPRNRTHTRLALLDGNLESRETRELSGTHAVAAAGEYVYTASENGFSTFDADLERVGRVPRPEEYAGKHMEDVLVHDGVAYVVDDVVVPLYLYRVGVSDPAAPSYLEVVPVLGINQTLGQQWIEPGANGWRVLQRTSHQRGGEQNVLVTPLEGATAQETVEEAGESYDVRATDEVGSLTVYSYDRATDGESSGSEGTTIEDVAGRPPVYAAVRTGGTNYLSSVSVSPGGVSFGREVELDAPARVETTDDHVFALSTAGTLYWFAPAREAVRLERELPIDDPVELAVRR